MEACPAALGRDNAGDEVPDGERCMDKEIRKDLRAFSRKTIIAKAKLVVGEEWATRTVETTSPVGHPRPLALELLAG